MMHKESRTIEFKKDIVNQDIIEKKIFLIRDLNVMLDRGLAELYGVKTKSLNLAVKRNIDWMSIFFFLNVLNSINRMAYWYHLKKRSKRYWQEHAIEISEEGV